MDLKNILVNNRVVKNASILVGGTAFAQLLSILTLPILTRLYSPEDFSVLAVYTSLLALITAIVCMRFEIAIPLPKKDSEALNLLILSCLSVVLITMLTTLGIILFSDQLALLTKGKLIGYEWLIPISVFFAGLYRALQFWSTRHKAFGLIAKTRMTQALGGSGTQLGLGFLGVTPLGLIVGQAISVGFGIIGLGSYTIKNSLSLITKSKAPNIINTLKRYDRFPKYSVFESFANSGATQLPVLLIAYYTIGAEVGYLMLAVRLLSAPITLVGASISQVYLSEAAEKFSQGQLKSFTITIIKSLIKISLLPLVLIAFLSPFLVPYVFGEDWYRTGVLIAWMSPWFLMQFITSPVSMALHVIESQNIAMMLQFFGLILRVGMVLITGLYYSEYIGEMYALSGFIFYSVYLFIVLKVLNLKER